MFPFREGGHWSSHKKWHSMKEMRKKKSWVMKAKKKYKWNRLERGLKSTNWKGQKVGWSSNWKEIEDWLYIRTRQIKEGELDQGRDELADTSHLLAPFIILPLSSVPRESWEPSQQTFPGHSSCSQRVTQALPACSDGPAPPSKGGMNIQAPRNTSQFLLPQHQDKGRSASKVCKWMYFVNKWFPSLLLLWMSDCCGGKAHC